MNIFFLILFSTLTLASHNRTTHECNVTADNYLYKINDIRGYYQV